MVQQSLPPLAQDPPSSAAPRRPAGDDQATIDAVLRLTERLLKTGSLDPDSRFIDLTTDVRKAFLFLREFRRRFNFDLPISAFFDTPRLRDLAHVGASGEMPPLSRLVLLRQGDQDIPPLFIIPGLGGVLFEVLELSKILPYGGAIYGFAAPGLDGVDPPSVSTAIFARENVALARTVCGKGPFRFLGHSSGGVAALEMAISAKTAGDDLDFFGVLDTNFSEHAWPFYIWLRHMLDRAGKSPGAGKVDQKSDVSSVPAGGAGEQAGGLIRRPISLAARTGARVIGHMERTIRKLRFRFFVDFDSPEFLTADPYYVPNLPPKFQRVRDAAIVMASKYRPTFYDGEMFLFQAELGDPLACDPKLTWRRVVRRMIVVPTPGGHMSMLLQPHVAAVAREVGKSLKDIEELRVQNLRRAKKPAPAALDPRKS